MPIDLLTRRSAIHAGVKSGKSHDEIASELGLTKEQVALALTAWPVHVPSVRAKAPAVSSKPPAVAKATVTPKPVKMTARDVRVGDFAGRTRKNLREVVRVRKSTTNAKIQFAGSEHINPGLDQPIWVVRND